MYCFKIFYTLKPSTHIKINFKVATDHLLVRYSVVLRQHAAAEPHCNVISGNFGIGTTCSLMMVQWDRNM